MLALASTISEKWKDGGTESEIIVGWSDKWMNGKKVNLASVDYSQISCQKIK